MTARLHDLWCQWMVEELIRLGITRFYIAPGSRLTPLTVAAVRHPAATIQQHFDERSLTFRAMGYAASSGSPAVVITTSGTAAANCLPGVIEASKKKLPLLVITADRPPELRETGAHQTIQQVELFGKYVRWFFDVPAASEEIAPEFVLTTIDQAVHRMKGSQPGPVHLNWMFREPLEPSVKIPRADQYSRSLVSWKDSTTPWTDYHRAERKVSSRQLHPVLELIQKSRRGIIVVGKLKNPSSRARVLKLAEKLKWPVFPDISSGLRLGHSEPCLISHFDLLLGNRVFRESLRPDCVLHLGGRMTSRRWYDWMKGIQDLPYIHVLGHPLRSDPLHRVRHRVEAPVDEVCRSLVSNVPSRKTGGLLQRCQNAQRSIQQFLDETDQSRPSAEITIARCLSRMIPRGHQLFLSNSLPVREIDTFAANDGYAVTVHGNRGASGIDGIISTACGISDGDPQPVTLLIGDLAALYDLNAFAMIPQLPRPMTVVIFNNRGGSIFHRLPIARHKDVFEPYFTTPHPWDFHAAARMFGIRYQDVNDVSGFQEAYTRALKGNESYIIEVRTERKAEGEIVRKIDRSIDKMELGPPNSKTQRNSR